MCLRASAAMVAWLLAINVVAQSRPAPQGPTREPALPGYLVGVPRLPLSLTEVKVRLPAGEALGMVSWVALDPKREELWLLQRGSKAEPVLAIDASGHVVHAFGRGQFKVPHAIAIDPEEHVWTVDAGSSRVIEWSEEGKELRSIDVPMGRAAAGSGFGGATDVAFGPGGRVFVSDGYANARVLEFTRGGAKVREWGSAGRGPGEFDLPHALCIDERGAVYVADRENGRIERFDLGGKYLGEIDGLGRVYAVAMGPEGSLWASMSPMDQPPGAPGWIVKLDGASGRTLGYVPVREAGGLHTLAVDEKGEPITDFGNGVMWFRKQPQSQPAR